MRAAFPIACAILFLKPAVAMALTPADMPKPGANDRIISAFKSICLDNGLDSPAQDMIATSGDLRFKPAASANRIRKYTNLFQQLIIAETDEKHVCMVALLVLSGTQLETSAAEAASILNVGAGAVDKLNGQVIWNTLLKNYPTEIVWKLRDMGGVKSVTLIASTIKAK